MALTAEMKPTVAERLDYIRTRLLDDATYADIARELGVTRERIRQFVNDHIGEEELDELRGRCLRCGEPLPPERTRQRRYHAACRRLHENEQNRLARYRQRRHLTWSEEIAIKEYRAQGLSANWAPHKAPFDFWVGGLRVDVKGSHLTQERGLSLGYHWGLNSMTQGEAAQERLGYNDFPKRCDIFHCIGVGEGQVHHLLIPSADVGARQAILWAPPKSSSRGSMWDKYTDYWQLLGGVN